MKRAILQLQRAISRRFGKDSGNGAGSCELHISARGAELIDAGNVIEARGPATVVKVLRRRRKK